MNSGGGACISNLLFPAGTSERACPSTKSFPGGNSSEGSWRAHPQAQHIQVGLHLVPQPVFRATPAYLFCLCPRQIRAQRS